MRLIILGSGFYSHQSFGQWSKFLANLLNLLSCNLGKTPLCYFLPIQCKKIPQCLFKFNTFCENTSHRWFNICTFVKMFISITYTCNSIQPIGHQRKPTSIHQIWLQISGNFNQIDQFENFFIYWNDTKLKMWNIKFIKLLQLENCVQYIYYLVNMLQVLK